MGHGQHTKRNCPKNRDALPSHDPIQNINERSKAKPIDKVTPEIQQLAADMLETMYAEKGIGLAAIQVGVEKRLVVMDIRPVGDDDRYDLSGFSELEKQVPMCKADSPRDIHPTTHSCFVDAPRSPRLDWREQSNS